MNKYKIGELEQTLATGLSEEGTPITEEILIQKINEFIVDEKINSMDKLRLVLIALNTVKLEEKNAKSMAKKSAKDSNDVEPY